MLYSIIDTKKGEDAGFKQIAHVLLEKGQKMIVNENELRTIDENIEEVAKSLGGSILTHSKVITIQKTNK